MHTRSRTWPLNSDPVQRCRDRTGLIDSPDGSTLSLDFTTGVLDPRLTFDRLSTATFINSSGLVQFANANLMTYSTPRASGSAWGPNGTVTWGSATITDPLGNATAQEVTFGTAASAIFNTAGTTVVSGITHTFSVWLRAASGTTNVRIGDANVAPVSTVTLTTTWQRFSCQYVASGTNDGGAIFSQTGTPSSTFYVWGAQVQPGSIVGELLETTGTLRRNIPRFDYDPSTLAPKGLLIEGSATNLAFYSEYINPNAAPWNVYWFVAGAGASVTPVSQADPAGSTTASRCVLGTSGAGRVYNGISTTAGVTYTLSFWARSVSGTTSLAFWHFNSATGNSTAVTIGTSWQRYQVAILGRTGGGFVECGIANLTTNAATIDLWGLQFETGSGASSYIPTGASTGSRAADVCYMANADYGFSTSGGTYLAEWHRGSNITTGSTGNNAFATDYASGRWLGIYTIGAGSTGTAGSWSGYLTSSGAVSGINKMAVSYSSWVASASGNTSLNGGAIVSGTLTLGTTPTYLFVGAASQIAPYNGGGFRDPLNNCVRRIKYWPTALPTAQLQSLTT